jgi:nucleotide-binding universal stress UspA family protein
MSYKTILVHVDESRHVDKRIEIAANLAVTENAHLVGVASTGISRFIYQSTSFGAGDQSMAPYLQTIQQQANIALEKFDHIAQGAGVLSFEKRLVDDDAASAMSLHGRYADLVVIGQNDPDEPLSYLDSGFVEYVTMNCGCPALVIPCVGSFNTIGGKVLIAWNASMEAARSVRSAIPLLKSANIVELAVFNPDEKSDAHGRQPGHDIALFLARHDINVDVMKEVTKGDVGEALLSLAENLRSDLLVMGCYGHTRFREILLGGATRTIINSMTIPVLMSH